MFSIAHLTTIAIMDGLVDSLVYRYLSDVRSLSGPGFCALQSGSCTSRKMALRTRLEKRARDEAEGVLNDIQALIGITDVRSPALVSFEFFSCCICIGTAKGMPCMDRALLIVSLRLGSKFS